MQLWSRASTRQLGRAALRTVAWRSPARVGYVPLPRTYMNTRPVSRHDTLPYDDLDASGSFVNINEDDSIPIRILKVSPTEIKLANGDVVPPTCIFLQGQTFVWTPPPVDPMTAMPSGKGWEAWTEDVWSIFDMTMPKPEILVFGTGNTVLPVPHKIRSLLHSMGIQLDVQNTRHACSTFNLLTEEGRNVAAALLPLT